MKNIKKIAKEILAEKDVEIVKLVEKITEKKEAITTLLNKTLEDVLDEKARPIYKIRHLKETLDELSSELDQTKYIIEKVGRFT
jgi:arginine deiminase